MAAAASVLLGCLCVVLLRHTSGSVVPTIVTAAPDDLTEAADIATATAAAVATSGASETTGNAGTTIFIPIIENIDDTTAIIEDAFSTEGAPTTFTRRIDSTDAPETTVTFIADVTDATTTGSFSADPDSTATTAKEQPPTATEESTAWQVSSPSKQHSLDSVLDVVFELAGNISDSTSRRYVTELKERLGEQSAALRRDTQLAASSSETAVRLLAGDGGIQDTVQALQTGQARAEAERSALREDLTQLKESVAQLQSDQSRLMRLLISIHQYQLLPSCPAGWSRHGTSCFVIHTEIASWDQAERICQQKHPQARLTSVHPDTAQHIRQLVEDYEGWTFWIGLRRHVQPPVWRWSDGTQVDHTDWLPGEPNDAGGEEDCVHEWHQGEGQHGWNDRDCSHQLKFICQIRAPPSPALAL